MTDLGHLVSAPGVHKDDRRRIVDVTPRVKVFTVADMPGLELANHYHAKTDEVFHVLQGELRMKFEEISTQKRACMIMLRLF